MKSKIFKNSRFYALSLFAKNLYSFGENPWRIATWVIFVISAFGVVIFSINEMAFIDLSNIKKPMSMVIDSAHIESYDKIKINDPCRRNNARNCLELLNKYAGYHIFGKFFNFLNSLYISMVTFTTLGFGDYRPIGYSKAFLAIEAIIGAALIALFVSAFGRRTAGK